MTNEFFQSLPLYYEVDGDVFVKLYAVGEEIRGINHWGNPYPAGNAVLNGRPTTRAAYIGAVENRTGQPVPIRPRASV
jgi:hypothetical protein